MKVLAFLAMIVLAVVVLIPPVGAKRGGGDDREQRCLYRQQTPTYDLRIMCSDGHD